MATSITTVRAAYREDADAQLRSAIQEALSHERLVICELQEDIASGDMGAISAYDEALATYKALEKDLGRLH